MSVFTKQLRKKLFQANYLMFATHELSKFCENLPLDDTKFRPNNNLIKIAEKYQELHELLLKDLESAVNAYEDNDQDIDDSYVMLTELKSIFTDLVKSL